TIVGTLSSTTDALVLSGVLTSAGANVTGNAIHLTGGGGIAASGSIHVASLTGDAGTTVTATGPLTLGSTSAARIQLLGKLDAGACPVTFASTFIDTLGRLTTLEGGSITETGNNLLLPSSADTLEGVGTVANGLLAHGVVEPGQAGGTLTVNGPCSLFAD